MKHRKTNICLLLSVGFTIFFCSCSGRWHEEQGDGYNLIIHKNGPVLGYSPESGVQIIQDGRLAFKDLNKNGVLDLYEDWRLSALVRSQDLASRLSVDEIAGLMLYSSHQPIPAGPEIFGGATYAGKPFDESGAQPYDLTDQQKRFLKEDNLRAILISSVLDPETAARWNNKEQAFVEGLGHGIPSNNSSDPRNMTTATAEFNEGAGGKISLWPTPLGLAATFDSGIMERFAEIASAEYRALGFATALSPQIDLATEPRWSRCNGTFGEDPELATEFARIYIDGFQTTTDSPDGWGSKSVNAMVKHWPGGGPVEGGREAHFNYGKYSIYPGKQFETHLKPFVDGAFKLKGGTGKASAVMPYYTIPFGADPSGENVGNSFSKYIITDLLRERYEYDGVICTDWKIVLDNNSVEGFDGKCWGAEELSYGERHYKCLLAGVDMYGGIQDKSGVLEAYGMWAEEFGEDSARKRLEESAVRLLMNYFRTGLFENPYVDPASTSALVGNPEYMKAGYDAQVKSIVMVKNHDSVLPIEKGKKIYVPQRYYPQTPGSFSTWNKMGPPAYWASPIDRQSVGQIYEWTDNPVEADFALVMIQEPWQDTGYSVKDREEGGNGYMPITLQYRPYTAEYARTESVAGGDPKENFINRSYHGKTVTTYNEEDLNTVIRTKELMGGRPVIVAVDVNRPIVMSEFEPYADGILVCFGVQNQAILDIISGKAEPYGLLPMQFPADMKAVEEQLEDTPHDMRCLTDSDGNTYDFAFGLDWSGIIDDERVRKYKK